MYIRLFVCSFLCMCVRSPLTSWPCCVSVWVCVFWGMCVWEWELAGVHTHWSVCVLFLCVYVCAITTDLITLLCCSDSGLVLKSIHIPREDGRSQEITLEELQVFKVPVCLFSLSVRFAVCLSVLSSCLSVCLYVCCLSVCLFICLSWMFCLSSACPVKLSTLKKFLTDHFLTCSIAACLTLFFVSQLESPVTAMTLSKKKVRDC